VTDRFEQARDELYGLDPDEFMARRAELTQAAKSAGDAVVAKSIGALRKPTRSAYAVNLLVRQEPGVADRIEEIGGRLRDAQRQLDGALLRELSTERNRLVDELARAALRAAGRGASASLRDEIAGTIGAAVADPEILDRLRSGALVRAETWSGLGVADGPALTLVHSAKGVPSRHAEQPDEPNPVEERARERQEARLRRAQDALAAAEGRFDEAHARLAEQRRAVRQLEDQLKDERRRLDEAELEARRAQAAVDKARRAIDSADR
jgi:hypothetical protein